ncbi:MAG: CapA family protein [Candidatus Hatepunaea meridiana]|nr:CapA family protein [Candidatus Hatepunaea meridiana]
MNYPDLMRVKTFFTLIFILYSFSLPLKTLATDDEKSGIVKLAFVGDIFLGNWAVEFLEKEGMDYPFHGCKDIFQEVDLVIGNLESPITVATEPFIEKQFLLKSPPGIEKGLFSANIRAVNLANNHILDYGTAGLKSTVQSLQSASIQHFGAGFKLGEALKEAKFTIRKQTIALLGFSATFPEEFWATDTSAGTAFPAEDDVIKTVSRCAKEYDIVVVSFHWGAEKMEFPKDYQVELAHLCIDYGADLIIGHHPHVVQGIELYHNVPIFYSLGNYAFASYSKSAITGLIARVHLSDGKVVLAEAIPINVNNYERNFQPVPLEKDRYSLFINDLGSLSLSLNEGRNVISKSGMVQLGNE